MLEWNSTDQMQAEAFRLNRLRQIFTDKLAPCYLHLGQNNILNIHASTPEAVDRLTDDLEQLAWFTWICTGAIELAIWFCQEELLTLPTQPIAVEEKSLNSLQSAEYLLTNEDFSAMATTTLSRPTSSQIAALIEKSRPQLKRLSTVAAAMQISIEEAEGICDRQGLQIQLDESGDPVIRLDDAADMLKDAAMIKLSAPPQNGARNGKSGTITADAIAQIAEPEAATSEPAQRAYKMAELPKGFRATTNFKQTATKALSAFVPNEKNQKRRRQIAVAISNQTADGLKYLRGLTALYPEDQQAKAKDQLLAQFKKQAESLSKEIEATPAT